MLVTLQLALVGTFSDQATMLSFHRLGFGRDDVNTATWGEG